MKRIVTGVLFAALGLGGTGCHLAKPVHGVKTGVIVKIAEEGWLVQTYEAQLLRGGLSDGSGAMGQAFDFNIKAGPTLDAARAAMDSGVEVEVEYERRMITSILDREHPTAPTAIAVRPLKSKQEP